jgi:cytochrome bd-type quinol oxidase subunit 2
MHPSLTNIIIIIACAVLIILIMLVYVRSSQGDQRIIRVTNQMLLPMLSAIVITLGFIFNSQGQLACTQGVGGSLRYVATLGAVLIVLIGVVRYALSQNRDRRFITHAVLLAIVFVLAILIIELLSGCM